MRKAALGVSLVLLCAAGARDAGASVSLTVVFDALVEESTASAVVSAMEQSSVWEGGRIVTYTHLRVEDRLAGSLGQEAWVRSLGGVVGDVGQQVEGEATFTMGNRYVVFLKPSVQGTSMAVVARAQGEFPVQNAKVTSRVTATLPPRPDVVARIQARTQAPEAVLPASAVLSGHSVEDTRALVAAAWQRTHAR